MSRVTLSASAALVLLLAACGGSSSSDGPSLEDQIENEIDDNDGVLDGQIITTPDGTRYVVDAIDPNAPGVSSGYLLVARLDSRGQPVEVVQAAAIGDAYVRPSTTGTFTYSGNNVSYISADGAGFQRFEGNSSLSLDFGDDDGNGRSKHARTGDGEAPRGDRRAARFRCRHGQVSPATAARCATPTTTAHGPAPGASRAA